MSRPLLVLTLTLLALGCSDPEPTDGGEVATFEEMTYSDATASESELTVRAVFVGSLYDGDAVMVEHEEIPGRMPAMRMPFMLERPDLISGLSEGDKVLLTIRNDEMGTGFAVTAIEPLPASTVLDLEGSGADSAFVPPGL